MVSCMQTRQRRPIIEGVYVLASYCWIGCTRARMECNLHAPQTWISSRNPAVESQPVNTGIAVTHRMCQTSLRCNFRTSSQVSFETKRFRKNIQPWQQSFGQCVPSMAVFEARRRQRHLLAVKYQLTTAQSTQAVLSFTRLNKHNQRRPVMLYTAFPPPASCLLQDEHPNPITKEQAHHNVLH